MKRKLELQELKYISENIMIHATEEIEELKVWRAVYDLGFQSILGPRNHAKRIEKVNKDFKLYQIYIIFELY